jgi:hypothetical protein
MVLKKIYSKFLCKGLVKYYYKFQKKFCLTFTLNSLVFIK